MPLDQAPIRVFNASLAFRAEINLYDSAFFQRLDYGIGEFQIQINLNVPYTSELQQGYFVQFDYDIKKMGIIIETTKRIGEKGKGDQVLIVKGREIKYILSQRLIIPPADYDTYETTAAAETALKSLVSFQAGTTCPDSTRKLLSPALVINTDQARGVQYYLNERNTVLSEVLEKLCLACEMGYYIYFDEGNKQFCLEVNFGTDHTAQQTTNGQVLFSVERNTIRKGELTQTMAQYKNVCYAAGEGQGQDRNIRVVYNDATEPTSWNRFETLLDVKQITSDTDIDAAGAKRLNETQYQLFSNGQFLNYSTYVYGKNFDLGDYVTTVIYDVTTNVKITGVRESWAKGKYEIDFDYDKSYPQFQKAVNTRLDNIQGVLNNTELVSLTGAVVPFAGSTAPTGWLICDGSSLERAGKYAKLFAVIGTAFGAVDGSHFSIPDCRGIFISGAGTSAKLKNANGSWFTRTLATYQNDKLQGHEHTHNAFGMTAGTWPVDGTYTLYNGIKNTGTAPTYSYTPVNDGTNGVPRIGTETNPANLAMNHIIKY